MIPILERIKRGNSTTAIEDKNGTYTYFLIEEKSNQLAYKLINYKNQNIALLAESSINYVIGMLAIWKSANTAVPLNANYPKSELSYYIENAECNLILNDQINSEIAKSFATESIQIDSKNDELKEYTLPSISLEDNALIIFTSGTTGKPKGVVHTHKSLDFQFQTLSNAWKWSSNDSIPVFLPLHHIHGIINKLCCALYNNAKATMYIRFETESIFNAILENKFNVLMAVPTIYKTLIDHYQEQPKEIQKAFSIACSKFRLMISGSAALPVSFLEKWQSISSHTLLERYGMSEIGMAISNPYNGKRQAGWIGSPFKGIETILIDDTGKTLHSDNEPGEIAIKGENLFREYWSNTKATKESYNKEGFFLTGDMAIRENNCFKIIGRKSIDIIKTGGYKVSALEIEEIIRQFSGIEDCAVIGIEDEKWGETIHAVITGNFEKENLKSFLAKNLPKHKIPKHYHNMEQLLKNAMGKIDKKAIKNWILNE